MSTVVLMKAFEVSPARYDVGMSVITLNSVHRIRAMIANSIPDGSKVLDIGCGPGSIFPYLKNKRVHITGLDISHDMIQYATERITKENIKNVVLLKRTAMEIDSLFSNGQFDVILLSFILSELRESEQDWLLEQVYRKLISGGKIIVVDEIKPKSFIFKTIFFFFRLPIHFIAYIHSQIQLLFTPSWLKKAYYILIESPLILLSFVLGEPVSRPLSDINYRISKYFKIVKQKYFLFGSIKFIEAVRE